MSDRSPQTAAPPKATTTKRAPIERAARAPASLGGRRHSAPPDDLRALHARVGNRGVGRLVGRARAASDPVEVARGGLSGSAGPLPHLGSIQAAFGRYDVSGVQAYRGRAARTANQTLGSESYTIGEKMALSGPTPLHIAAHEATHVLQARAGLSLPGGMGRPGDRHECLADKVAGEVGRGRSVEKLLDKSIGPRARRASGPRASAPVQMYTKLTRQQQQGVRDRITARGGTGTTVDIEDAFYTGKKGTALVASDVASMAADVRFEMAAERFEEGIGVLAYNHPRTKAVCQQGADKAMAYFDAKHAEALDKTRAVDEELKTLGMSDPGWSGAVGKSARVIREMLRKGSVSEQVAHVESFVINILARDVMENEVDWRSFAQTAGYDRNRLDEAYRKVAFTGDRYLMYDTAEDSAIGMQWRTRANMQDVRDKRGGTKDKFHPSSVKAYKAPEVPSSPEQSVSKIKGGDEAVTTRDVDRIEMPSPLGLGIKLGEHEKAFQESSTSDDKKLRWVEGARVFALNELDSWVYAQRQLSLPLVAGTSSTGARIMESFRFLGVGPADDVRLATLAVMLTGRHHSLVEVMEAAKRHGASPYRQGAMMYHDLSPLDDEYIRRAGLLFPDEVVDPNHLRGGYTVPLPPPLPPQQPAPQLDLFGRRAPRDVDVTDYATEIDGAKTFTWTRASINTTLGISNTFEDRNSAQARMLRAVDAYHTATTETDRRTQLEAVRNEAAHWLTKHPYRKYWFSYSKDTRSKFERLRDDAQQAIDDIAAMHEQAQYLRDFAGDRLLALKSHVSEAVSDYRSAHRDRSDPTLTPLIKDNGLTLAEVLAIKAYSGPAYKYINVALEDRDDEMTPRLLSFVREIKTATNTGLNAKQRIDAAERTRQKLATSDDAKQRAKDEGKLHARIAMRGLSKLPAYTGEVFAGGAITRREALERFRTGDVQERGAFASTSAQEFVASQFALTKGEKLEAAYKSVPSDERDPADAPFPFMLRYTSKTGRYIEPLSASAGEEEVLFSPGSKLRIVKGADHPSAEKKMGWSDDPTVEDKVLKWTYIDAEEVT